MLASIAIAGVPEGLRLVATDPGAPERYRAWRAEQGLPAAELACEPLWAGATLLCFRVWESGKRRWVDAADLKAWDVTTSDLRAKVAAEAPKHVAKADQVEIGGMEASYLQLVDGDGWAVSGVLRPQALTERLGGLPIRAALPGEGVLVAWRAGSPELEQVMAVGVRELFEGESGGLSPRIYQWDGKTWLPYGEAVPKVE